MTIGIPALSPEIVRQINDVALSRDVDQEAVYKSLAEKVEVLRKSLNNGNETDKKIFESIERRLNGLRNGMDTLGYENRTFNQLTTSLNTSMENLSGYLKVELNNAPNTVVQQPNVNTVAVKPYGVASRSENGEVNTSINISKELRENALTKDAVEKFDSRISAAQGQIADAVFAKNNARVSSDHKYSLYSDFAKEVNAFAVDVQDFSRGNYSEEGIKYWRDKLGLEYGLLLSQEDRTALFSANSKEEILTLCQKYLGVDGQEGSLDVKIAELKKAKDDAALALTNAENTVKEKEDAYIAEVKAASDELSNTINELAKDPANAYLRDFLRARDSGNPVVGFRSEELRVHKESLTDSVSSILSSANLNPILAKALEERRMLTEAEKKAIGKDEKGLANLVDLMAVYGSDGTSKIHDQDISALEGMISGFDSIKPGKDKDTLSKQKMFDLEIGEALKGFLEKGIVGADGNLVRGTKELAAHWGVTERAVKHLFGSIDEGYFYGKNFAGINGADPEVVAKLGSEVSRLLLDRTDRKPWYGYLNLQDGLAFGLAAAFPIAGVGPLGSGALAVAARRERSGILGLAMTIFSISQRHRSNNSTNNSGGGNGNGNGNGNGSGEP